MTFNQGIDVTLDCIKMWGEMLYTNWTMDLKNKRCQMDFDSDGQGLNSCEDGKTLHNTSTGESYLLIPNISISDEGVYTCTFGHKGGTDFAIYKVSVRGKTLISLTGHILLFM